MGDYTDVLKRLYMYRKSVGLVQRELAACVGIGQEQYSYIENGSVKISGHLLLEFMKVGFGTDELIAGRSYIYEADDLDRAINTIDTEENKNFALKLLAELIVKRSREMREYITGETADNMEMLDALLNSWNDFSMTQFVRTRLSLSQIEMAERLGLGIKKYRELERETIYPDAETLLSLYNMSNYQPTLFMNMSDRKIQIIKSIWCIFTPSEKEKLLNYAVASANILD